MTKAPDYEFTDSVTSDLSFIARGPDLESIFAAAAEALLAATVEEPASVQPSEQRPITLEEPDIELLLLRFLNELVYLRDAEHLLLRVASIRVQSNRGASLEAQLEGEKIDRTRHTLAAEVKAATAHGLQVSKTTQGLEATVTLDV